MVYPNPSSAQVTVSLTDSKASSTDFKKPNAQIQIIDLVEISEIKVFDKMATLKKVLKYGNGNRKTTFNIYDLPSDLYYLEVSDRKNRARIPLVVRK